MVVLGSYQKDLGSMQHFPCAFFLNIFFLRVTLPVYYAEFAMFNIDLSTACLHVQ